MAHQQIKRLFPFREFANRSSDGVTGDLGDRHSVSLIVSLFGCLMKWIEYKSNKCESVGRIGFQKDMT